MAKALELVEKEKTPGKGVGFWENVEIWAS